jgi:hypothetical protein
MSDNRRLLVTPQAWKTMWLFVKNARASVNGSLQEISWLGTVKLFGEDMLLSEVFLVDQDNSAGHSDFDDNATTNLMMALSNEGRGDEVADIKLWGHSHGTLPAFFSATDDNTIRTWVGGSWMVALVLNAAGDMQCWLNTYDPWWMHEELDVVLFVPTTQGDVDEVRQLIAERCKFNSYQPTLTGPGHYGGAWDAKTGLPPSEKGLREGMERWENGVWWRWYEREQEWSRGKDFAKKDTATLRDRPFRWNAQKGRWDPIPTSGVVVSTSKPTEHQMASSPLDMGEMSWSEMYGYVPLTASASTELDADEALLLLARDLDTKADVGRDMEDPELAGWSLDLEGLTSRLEGDIEYLTEFLGLNKAEVTSLEAFVELLIPEEAAKAFLEQQDSEVALDDGV